MFCFFIAFNDLAELIAIKLRHGDIRENEIRQPLMHFSKPIDAVAGYNNTVSPAFKSH